MESHGHVTYSLFHRHCGAAASLIHRFFISSLNPFFSLINNNSCLPTIRYIHTHREIYIYKIISLRNTFLTSYSLSLSLPLSFFFSLRAHGMLPYQFLLYQRRASARIPMWLCIRTLPSHGSHFRPTFMTIILASLQIISVRQWALDHKHNENNTKTIWHNNMKWH